MQEYNRNTHRSTILYATGTGSLLDRVTGGEDLFCMRSSTPIYRTGS